MAEAVPFSHRLQQEVALWAPYLALVGSSQAAVWGTVANRVTCAMRWPDFEVEPESFATACRTEAAVHGWSGVFVELAIAIAAIEVNLAATK